MRCKIFTLCSNNYLAQAKTLGDSIHRYHPEAKFIIGLVDKKHSDIDYSFFNPYQIISYDELGFDVFDEMLSRYNIVEFNTAVKPFYFEFLANGLEEHDHIYYIDPDILLHKPLIEVIEALVFNDFVLTPHKLIPAIKPGDFERLINNVGTFNLGFLALRLTAQTRFFMNWWQERLKTDCRIQFNEGLFVDQIWANQIPCMYDKVHILKHPGYNMGYWNFSERKLSESLGGFFVNGQYPLVFFHYSSYNPLEPENLCKWLNYSFEERPDLRKLYSTYQETLISNQYRKFSQLPRGLDFKLNHPHVDPKIKNDKVTAVIDKEHISLRKKVGYGLRNRTNKLYKFIFDL